MIASIKKKYMNKKSNYKEQNLSLRNLRLMVDLSSYYLKWTIQLSVIWEVRCLGQKFDEGRHITEVCLLCTKMILLDNHW